MTYARPWAIPAASNAGVMRNAAKRLRAVPFTSNFRKTLRLPWVAMTASLFPVAGLTKSHRDRPNSRSRISCASRVSGVICCLLRPSLRAPAEDFRVAGIPFGVAAGGADEGEEGCALGTFVGAA